MRAEFADGHREIDAFHLRAHHLLDRQVALVGSVDLDLVARRVERREEGDGVDMVPVRV